MDNKIVRLLQMLAIAGGVLVVAGLLWDKGRREAPDDAAYRAASDAFNNRNYIRAAEFFARAVEKNGANLGARRGLANSLVQLARFDEAYLAIETVIAAQPENACNYATRGIIEDRRGRHLRAMTDYERAVAGCPAAADGMSWWKRVLTNTRGRPPTVAERLAYLKAQMALPEDQRVLRIPRVDGAQKPYEE